MPTPDQWKRIKDIVSAALELDSAEHAAYARDACQGDEALLAEVQSLLDAHQHSDGFSKSPDIGPVFAAFDSVQSFGPYRLDRKLGHGGMGQVWLAEQRFPVRRMVAIKLLSLGTFHPASLQRFQLEQQSLARMDHPAIAKIFDAGTSPDGRPYMVMEYVPGIPITDYCDLHKLSIRQRLELFQQVCEGVQHAHQKSIVHRDLKPSNILVTDANGKPCPRIIDFGIAKPISAGLAGEQTIFTQAGSLIGTPGYMSPEQLDPSIPDIDTRTDVYSLGVLLYVLLTGSLPVPKGDLTSRPVDEILRELRESDPPTPSTRVSTERNSATKAAQERNCDPPQLVSELRGDLDCITMKAMEKDRERRYATPADFAADIQRHIENLPVLARPASVGYRLRKYVRRNRLLVSAAAAAAILLLGFIGTLSYQLRRTTRERDRANRITDFMTLMFQVSDPSEARGNTVTAREILDKSSAEISSGMSKDPELQAQLMVTMGRVYIGLGLPAKAAELFQKSADIRKRLFGMRNRETLQSLDLLCWALQDLGRFQEAEKIENEILPLRQEILGSDDPDTLSSRTNLANALYGEGRFDDSLKVDREAIAIRKRVLPNDRDTFMEMSNLAATLGDLGRYKEAERLLQESLAGLQRITTLDDPMVIKVRANLADTYDKLGRYSDAEALDRELLDARRRVLGPEHPDTINNISDLAAVLSHQGRFAEAEKLHREALAQQKRTVGSEHPQTLGTLLGLAYDLAGQKRFAESENLLRGILDVQKRTLGAGNADTLATQAYFATVLRRLGRFDEAKALSSPMLDPGRFPVLSDPTAALSLYNLAGIAAARGDSSQALDLLQQAADRHLNRIFIQDIENDHDFQGLTSDPRFRQLVARIRAA